MNPRKVPWALLGIFLIFLLGLHSEIRQVEQKNELLEEEIDAIEKLIAIQISELSGRIYDLQVVHRKLEKQRDYLLGLRKPAEPVVAENSSESEEGKGHE